MNARKIFKLGGIAWAYATLNTFIAFIIAYAISHIGFLQKGFEMFFGVEPHWDWNKQFVALSGIYPSMFLFIFTIFMLQEWLDQRQLRKSSKWR